MLKKAREQVMKMQQEKSEMEMSEKIAEEASLKAKKVAMYLLKNAGTIDAEVMRTIDEVFWDLVE